MSFIKLSAAEAARVRYSEPGVCGLNPIEQIDGSFFLNEECKSDPLWGDFLKGLPPLVGEPSPKWRERQTAQTMVDVKAVQR